jgi:hypothetical protein
LPNLDKTDDVTMDMEVFRDFCEAVETLNSQPMRVVVITVPIEGGKPSTFSNIPPDATYDLVEFICDGFESQRMARHELPDNKPN